MKAAMSALAMRRTSKLRSAGVALFALFFLLVQPVCGAYERHMGAQHLASTATVHDAGQADNASLCSRDGVPCCTEMWADAMASASPVGADRNFSAAELILALPLAFLAPPGLTLRSHPGQGIPPPRPLSYHARSARILR